MGIPTRQQGSAANGLNFPERVLQGAHQLQTVVSAIFDPNVNADAVPTDPKALGGGLLGDLAAQADRLPKDVELVGKALEALKNKGVIDDRSYTMEDFIALAASLPPDSSNRDKITQAFIKNLWDNLRHPPLSYLGDDWKYRTADGSNNNRLFPKLGMAGSPYARSVKPKIKLSPVLPEPGLVFDELMARAGGAKPHPTGISSMLFYLASIIIHDIFRTDSCDPNRVTSSSYLDLSPLYGHSDADQLRIRAMHDGLLKPDTFSEVRLLGFPPGVAALLVCFNRYHNFIAQQLATINEGGRFTLKTRLSPSDKQRYGTPEAKRDNDLFQTARLVTCGLYVNIILIDYVRTILNLNRTDSDWSLDPRANYGNVFGPTGLPEGVGNQVSVEFNLIYRWHSAISNSDEEWSAKFFAEAAPNLDPTNCTTDEINQAFRNFLEPLAGLDPSEIEFGGLKRGTKGYYKDEDLVHLITTGTDDVAGAFGARNVPKVLRAVEMLGIQQARQWNVATLNEVRQYFGLAPHKTFADISSDVGVQNSLETLYKEPDLVEFYPGIVCEDAKVPQKPGSGLCPGFTISKAILSDAVALVRGDRFYTEDFDARTLTNWGSTEIASNKQVAGGGVIYKLFMRAFPQFYKGNSVYALFPFNPAETTRNILRELGTEDMYSFSRPTFIKVPDQITTAKAAEHVLGNHTNFKVPWGEHTFLMTGHDFMLSGDKPANREQHKFIKDAMFEPTSIDDSIRKLYEQVTMDVIQQHKRPLRDCFQIDMVSDIANLSHAIAVGKMFHLPLKLEESPIGLLTAPAFYTAASVLFAFVFLDVDPASHMALYQGAKASAEGLTKVVNYVVKLVQASDWNVLKHIQQYWHRSDDDMTKDFGVSLISRLSAGGKSAAEVTASILPTIAGAVPTQAQGLSQMIDLFFSDDYKHHWPIIQQLAKSEDPADFQKLRKYALEGMRLATPAFGVFRTVATEGMEIQDGPNLVKPEAGETIFVNFVKAGRDEAVFPHPEEIDLTRPDHIYLHHGWGSHRCIGRRLVEVSMATQLKILGRLKNLRPAPGLAGQLKSKEVQGFKVYMRPDWSSDWPFPTTMKFMFDGFET